MRKWIVTLISCLSILACSGEDDDSKAPSCDDIYTRCEWEAWRHGDTFTSYVFARECSWDYGVCIGQNNTDDCSEWCSILTAVPSACIDSCTWYRTDITMTSTAGAG